MKLILFSQYINFIFTQDFFNKPSFSDLIFKFENGQEIFCSKALICLFSKKMRDLLKEEDFTIIKISDFEFSTFYIAIEQLYNVFSLR